jgi:signal transduction histidine kinase
MKKIVGSISAVPILFSLLTLALRTPVMAQSGDSMPAPVVLTDGQGKYPLGLALEILEDPGKALSIEQVSSSQYDTKFIPSRVVVPNYGFSESAYWVRFHVRNNSSRTDPWLLEMGFLSMEYVDLYLPDANGKHWLVKQTGLSRPASSRDIPNNHILFALPLPAQEEHTVYLRFQNGGSMTLPLTLWLPETFYQSYAQELLLFGLYYGALLIMLVYHLFVFYSIREASYFYFVCFLASNILLYLVYDAFATLYIWPNWPILNRYALPLLLIATMASILMFVDTFLEAKARNPRVHRLIQFLMAGWGILLVLVPFISYGLILMLLAPYSIISLVGAAIGGLISWRNGYRPARFFLFAWVGVLLGMVISLSVREGFLPSTTLTENFSRIGRLWLIAFWSISLTDRVNLLKAEAESSTRALRASEQQLSEILEGLPLAVVVYGKDRKPSYGNQHTYAILSNPSQGIRPDISAGRTLDMAMVYYSLKVEGTDQPYPGEKFPGQKALLGEPAYADDIEADLGDRRIPLEIWASPMKDEMGNVEAAVIAFQDITQRKQEEAELLSYRERLEALVEERTLEANKANKKLLLRLDWLYTVTNANQTITGNESLAMRFKELSDRILLLLNAELVFVYRWDDQGERSNALSHTEEQQEHHDLDFVSALFQMGSPLRTEMELGKIVSHPSGQADSMTTLLGAHFPKHDMPCFVLAPIQIGPSVIGVLGVMASAATQNLILEESDLIERMALDLANLAQSAIFLEQALILATVEERNRLARELHDSVTQTLFTASVLAEATPHIWERDQDIARQNMVKLNRLIRGALAEMRSMLIELRMGTLHHQTLENLLLALVEGGRARSPSAISLSLGEDLPELPEKVMMGCYRIAREAIHNATIHSGASRIDVTVTGAPGQLELRIQDDGGGFEAELVPPGHLGLNIMEERAREIGATLTIQSAPGAGTTVRLAWPDQTGDTTQNG